MNRLIVGDKAANLYWTYIISDKVLEQIKKRIEKVLNVDKNDKSANEALEAIKIIESIGMKIKSENECKLASYTGVSFDYEKNLENSKIYTLPGTGTLNYTRKQLKKTDDVDIPKEAIINLINLAPMVNKEIKKIEKFTDDCGISNDLLINISKSSINHVLKLKKTLDGGKGEIKNESTMQMYGKSDTYAIFCSMKNNNKGVKIREVTGYLSDNKIIVGSISRAKLFESAGEAQKYIELSIGSGFHTNYAQVVKMNIEFEKVIGEPVIRSNDYSLRELKEVISERDRKEISSKIKNNANSKNSKKIKKI